MGRLEEARTILENTSIPAIGLTAIGIATFDINRVIEDYSFLRQDQRLDDIISSNSTLEDHLTHCIVWWQLFRDYPDDVLVLNFLNEVYPRLLACQQYIYEHCCPSDYGLIAVEHIIYPRLNSIFVSANESLLELGYALDRPSYDLFEKNEWTTHSMNELLWDESMGLYHNYDLTAQSVIENQYSSGFLPIIAGVPDIDQVLTMAHRAFGDDFRQEGHYSFPSYNLNLANFEDATYDKSTVNISTNWLFIQGLGRYDMEDLVDVVMEDTLVLLDRHGFYADFDPSKSNPENGIGTSQNHIPAAIYLHLLREEF